MSFNTTGQWLQKNTQDAGTYRQIRHPPKPPPLKEYPYAKDSTNNNGLLEQWIETTFSGCLNP